MQRKMFKLKRERRINFKGKKGKVLYLGGLGADGWWEAGFKRARKRERCTAKKFFWA